jgi:hypothetical protein
VSGLSQPTQINLKSNKSTNPFYLRFSAALTTFLFTYLLLVQVLGVSYNLKPIYVLLTTLVSLIIAIAVGQFTFRLPKINLLSSDFFLQLKQYSLTNKLLSILIFILLLIASISATFTVPNNWDSMTYHLPRMEHWFQNQSLWFYNTNNDRQLYMQGVNSLLYLILKSIGIGEVFYNFIQLFSLFAITLIIWSCLQRFKVNSQFSLSLILILVSVPNLVTESATTQTDILAALTVLLNFIFLIEIILKSTYQKTHLFYGLSFAVATFTKGTLFPYLLVSGLTYAFLVVLRDKKIFEVQRIVVLPATLLLNAFLWLQSIAKYGNTSGPQTSMGYFVQSPVSSGASPRDVAAAFIHFFTYNFQTFFYALNDLVYRAAFKLASLINVDLLNESNSWPDWDPVTHKITYIFTPSFGVNEDSATSPHFNFIFIASLLLFLFFIRKRNWPYAQIALAPMLYFITVIIFLRWNPYLGRYFIPAAVLAVLAIGILFKPGKKILAVVTLFSTMSFIYATPFALMSQNRPFWGENSIFSNSINEERFVSRPDLVRDFDRLEDRIRKSKPTSIEIAVGGNQWEYPIWALANRLGLDVHDYRDPEIQKGGSPMLVCYVSCLDAKARKLTFILQEPLPNNLVENQVIKFNAGNPKVLKSGWSTPEDWGVWSQADSASLEFEVTKSFLRSQSLILTLRSWQVDTTKTRAVRIEVNKVPFAILGVNEIGLDYSLEMPKSFLSSLPASEKLTIEFFFENLVSPADLNLGMDSRKLGIGLYKIESKS